MEEKKKSSASSKIVLAMLMGVLFGIFAGGTFYLTQVLTQQIPQNVMSIYTGKETGLSQADTSEGINQTEVTDVPDTDTSIGNTTNSQEENSTEGSLQKTDTVTAVVSDVTNVVDAVMPCVVSINNKYMYSGWYGEEEELASGSGIIVGQSDEELLIVTNNHVIDGYQELSVQFIDGKELQANVKGTDIKNDIAVISVPVSEIEEDTKNSIAVATLGNSDNLKVGEPAIAIGNSLGYGQSVTTGVISALNREVTIEETTSYLIQTDAAINPGNSGGALLNVKGEVVGINSNKIGGSIVEGMGYAIPISTAEPIIEELMQHDTKIKVSEDERAFLGIQGNDVTSEVEANYGMPEGVYVVEVIDGTCADTAGIKKGDIIVSLDGEKITTMTQLKQQMEYYTVGTELEVKFMRSGVNGYEEQTVTVMLGAKPKE